MAQAARPVMDGFMIAAAPWLIIATGYLVGIVVETPVLLVGLSPRHGFWRRVFAGVWLTACSYPIVTMVLPGLMAKLTPSRAVYLLVAETFAPVSECLLFWAVFDRVERCSRKEIVRDCGAIIAANLASFSLGELLGSLGLWRWLGA